MSKAPAGLFVLILGLATAAGAVLVFGSRPAAGEEKRAEEFQHLVGGLGFGPALDLEQCDFAFDPRLAPACPNDCGPIPGGVFFCPYHACSILDSPPLEARRDQGPPSDALLP
jgi:hypothetical protein